MGKGLCLGLIAVLILSARPLDAQVANFFGGAASSYSPLVRAAFRVLLSGPAFFLIPRPTGVETGEVVATVVEAMAAVATVAAAMAAVPMARAVTAEMRLRLQPRRLMQRLRLTSPEAIDADGRSIRPPIPKLCRLSMPFRP